MAVTSVTVIEKRPFQRDTGGFDAAGPLPATAGSGILFFFGLACLSRKFSKTARSVSPIIFTENDESLRKNSFASLRNFDTTGHQRRVHAAPTITLAPKVRIVALN